MKLDNVVIVLGKRLVKNKLSPEGISRVQALVSSLGSLSIENTAILFCGGKTHGQNIAEADAMFRYFQILNKGLSRPFPESQILIENRSLNTFQNMKNAAEELCHSGLFQAAGYYQSPIKVTLVSNDYHLERIIEIQTLMDEQGLLRVLKTRCALMGLELSIALDIDRHISVPYPHHGTSAEAFLLLDELTTYRVYLEGAIRGVFSHDLAVVRAKPLHIAQTAIEKLEVLPLDHGFMQNIEEIKKAVVMTAFDDNLNVVQQALDIIYPLLTVMNRTIDPESAL
ncbi:YdcF family protein [Vibrio sp. EA2]|uniref:YdcF family protein n=1 Tax=Vibrio sp. EA2 TaxID=3079860 RepID=UPI00294925B1|nr:YdcF family protein [Vibrio sp. EA2]MDV6252236.1 YdcF family protein [Vibrio sp. EA2]